MHCRYWGNANSGGGGAGFSWRFPQPEYQRRHVQAYLAAHATKVDKASYNASARAFPDISALAMGGIPTVINVGLLSTRTPRMLSHTAATQTIPTAINARLLVSSPPPPPPPPYSRTPATH